MGSRRTPSPGTGNLAKARRFVDQAERIGAADPEAVATNLEAAIVFGKSVQDWLKDQHGGPWLKASPLWNSPLCKFFVETRNVIVHDDGSIEVLTQASVTIAVPVSVAVTETATVHVIPEPRASWRYRLWAALHNLRVRWAGPLRHWNANRQAQRRVAAQRKQAPASSVTRTEWLHFRHPDSNIGGRPAVDVVRDYLALLEQVVRNAPPLGTGSPKSV